MNWNTTNSIFKNTFVSHSIMFACVYDIFKELTSMQIL